jgi:hypothetical protein
MRPVSWDHLSLPGQDRATPLQSPRYGRRALRPWPGSDARPAPHAGSSRSDARASSCIARPPANSSRGDTVSLWKRPASCAPSVAGASAWSRYAAPPYSYECLCSRADTQHASDALCHARPARPPARSRPLSTVASPAPTLSLGASGGRDDGTDRGRHGWGRRATSTGVEDGRLIAVIGLGAERRPMPRTETLLGIVPPGPGVFLGSFAAAERPNPLAGGGDRRLVPQVASRGALLHPATLRLFCTTLPCASNATARGVPSPTRQSWHRSAWRPAIRSSRATVSWATWTKRAVARPPPPAPQ